MMLDMLYGGLLDNPERMRALRREGLLGTQPAEQDLATLLAAVAEAMAAPVAIIAMTEGPRIWFRLTHNLDLADLPLDALLFPVVAHAGRMVEDMAADPDCAALGWDARALRSCLLAPLLDALGAQHGTLCVMDRPRGAFDTEAAASLVELARVMAVLLPLHGIGQVGDLTATDPLLGVANRAMFHQQGRAAFKSAQEQPSARACALLHIRVERPPVHEAAGERWLRQAMLRIRAGLREVDVVGRLGPDEIAVLLPGLRQPRDGTHVADRMMARLAEQAKDAEPPPNSDIALTVKVSPRDGRSLDDLLEAAVGSGPVETPAFERALGEAVDQNALQVHLRPITGSEPHEPIGHELRLGWTPRSGPPLDPTALAALATRIGLSAEIDRLALQAACAAASSWRNGLMVSVPVSKAFLLDADAAETVHACLAETGLDPCLLQISLTEEALLGRDNLAHPPTIETLTQIRQIGVRIALAQIGTGIVSMARLHELPIDRIVFNPVFTQALGLNPRVATVIGAVVRLALSQGVAVAADNAERPEQRRLLGAWGCDAFVADAAPSTLTPATTGDLATVA